jgi:hypothetical protein
MRQEMLNIALGLGLALTVAAGCDKPKKDGDDAPAADGGQDGGSDAAHEGDAVDGGGNADQGGGEENGGDDTRSLYAPTGGDKNELASHGKQWTSDAAEPAEWSATSVAKTEVLGVYAEALDCKYRINRAQEGQPDFAYDVGCSAAPQCTETACEEKAIDAIDVGEFKQAQGTETKCHVVTETAAGKILTTSVTKTWTHADALREGEVVKSDSVSCTLALQGSEDGAGLDACAPPAGRVATISRNEETLTAQTKGEGKPELTAEPTGSFSVEGAFTPPADAKLSQVMCMAFNGQLTVSVTKSYCDAQHKPAAYSFSVSSLPIPSADEVRTNAYSPSLMVGQQAYMGLQAGACTVSYTGDEATGLLAGTASCEPNALADYTDPTKSVTVKDVAFSCYAPTGLFQ